MRINPKYNLDNWHSWHHVDLGHRFFLNYNYYVKTVIRRFPTDDIFNFFKYDFCYFF